MKKNHGVLKDASRTTYDPFFARCSLSTSQSSVKSTTLLNQLLVVKSDGSAQTLLGRVQAVFGTGNGQVHPRF